MRMGVLLAGALFIAWGCSKERKAVETMPVSPAAPEILNLADDFVAFWDATRNLPIDERVNAFKRDVASQYPAFYGVERFEGRIDSDRQDQRIAQAIEEFGAIREAFVLKAEAFDAELERNVETFRETFRDFSFNTAVVLLHSLGEMDGGTREIDGKTTLIFGADVMAAVHDWDDEAAFFHHELFHTYHEPRFGACEEVWCHLWTEGLAVHVARQLNPDAGAPELLLAFPEDLVPVTNERMGEALADLRGALGSAESKDLQRFFSMGDDETGLPPRRGYYLGMLVAGEIARAREISELAHLSREDAHALVRAAVDDLLADAKGGASPNKLK